MLGVLVAIDVDDDSWIRPAPMPKPVSEHPRGGSVAVAVSTPPEWSDRGPGGAALRQLTLPSLFVAQPDGRWNASLAEPGTDRTNKDAMAASFELRDAKWSNGAHITVDDLDRTKDERFVESVKLDGDLVRVHFKQKLPGWRSLWTSIAPPTDGLTSGPFRVRQVNSGVATLLERNDDWFAAGKANAPFLDEVRLTVVPDPATARQLLEDGRVDVVAAPASPTRQSFWDGKANVSIAKTDKGGRWAALRVNDANVPEGVRATLAGNFPRDAFVDGLLQGEAAKWNGFTGAGETTEAPEQKVSGQASLVLSPEEPTAPLLDNAFAKIGDDKGVKVSLRSASVAELPQLIERGDYDVAFVSGPSLPQQCWTCIYGTVDASLASDADAGDASAARDLEKQAAERNVFVPLWREHTVVAYRSDRVKGVQANGFGSSMAWGAEHWWRA